MKLGLVDWTAVRRDLDDLGVARLPTILSSAECDAAIALYGDETRFRKRVVMERLRFGAGEYQYFAAPLPPLVAQLRAAAYGPLAVIANDWQRHLGRATSFPRTLDGFLRRCRATGQRKPTPLMLRYEAGGYNRLHQDLYGDLAFPLQMTFLLSRHGADFEGGEMLFLENRPREQSIGTAVALRRGEGVVFAVGDRPIRGAHGFRRATLRHGVSRITSGRRFTLGIIFHDAK
ncbi:MAG TPA: 2OG-Fe(II) oxygenase [Candidatus Polarisedimenticolia bacterium]|nr:2OG-Fe(II) oxygenase [Candidatus Polarisedimenticolia bacterium]